MTTFDDRERSYEAKFVLDADQEFRAVARRNRMLGRWAGEQLGLSGEQLDDYCRSVVKADFEEAGDDDVLRKVSADLQGKADAAEIRAEMERLLQIARKEIAAGGSAGA
ncbi:MAG: DUF1476 domain-containing protein [Pseudomonadota bacterium]|nr:DUF1476 domain-containing protein [Pseudomonadota bacterium]